MTIMLRYTFFVKDLETKIHKLCAVDMSFVDDFNDNLVEKNHSIIHQTLSHLHFKQPIKVETTKRGLLTDQICTNASYGVDSIAKDSY